MSRVMANINKYNPGMFGSSQMGGTVGSDTMEWGINIPTADQIKNMAAKTPFYREQPNYGINTPNIPPDTNIQGTGSTAGVDKRIENISGIFGLPYQFSDIVDPTIGDSNIGRKYGEKIFSNMPLLFLTPGEPQFMAEASTKNKRRMAAQLAAVLGEGSLGESASVDEGRYYSFRENFLEYKRYANAALRALAIFMKIGDVEVPIPGTNNKPVPLKNIDVNDFLNGEFSRMWGHQSIIPFFLDAETSISETFSNNTTESMISQTVNGFSQAAKEVQFIMGSKDYGGLLKSIGSAVTDLGQNMASAMGELGSVVAGKNLLSRVANELTTIVAGGQIVFPEIWSDSEFDRSYNINIKLRSPDPDPVSVFLNIYMPLVLLISIASPRQIGNSSNSYESPFLVRAAYKSMFSCDLGMISQLNIQKGDKGGWNVMGHPITTDVTITIKDLYSTMFISKRMGLICNTAQMDYLATMAGVCMNEYEPTRILNLATNIIMNSPGDWLSDGWGRIKSNLNHATANLLSTFSDTRFLG